MATAPKKEAPTPEIVREEAKTFVQPKKAKVPIHGDVKTKKIAVDEQIVEVLAPLTGIPQVRIAPVNWVGPAPLIVPESRLDELIQLLTSVR